MARLTIDIEQEFRSELVAYLASLPLIGNVFDRRREFYSRIDFFSRLGVQNPDSQLKIRYAEVECLNITDDDVEGFDDNPAAVGSYNLHLFHEFEDLRSDDSNSDKDFTELLITLRAKMLQAPKLPLTTSGWTAVLEPVTPPEGVPFTQFGNDSLTDVRGHFKDLTIEVRFYEQ